MLDLSLVILTYNEEIHLERCLKSISSIVKDIYVIDSFSTDKTIEIAKKYNSIIIQNKWPGTQAKQLIWFFENHKIRTKWILRLDADEYVLPALKNELFNNLSDKRNNDVGGFILKRRLIFLKKWIKFGGYYPVKIIRVWQNGYGFWEDKEMDEHLIVKKGKIKKLKNDFVDENLNEFSWWIEKHNSYSTREVVNFLNGNISESEQTISKKIYNASPLFIRAIIFFIVRYIILLGFLDGKAGLIWHFMQGLWYRFLIDVKIIQSKINETK